LLGEGTDWGDDAFLAILEGGENMTTDDDDAWRAKNITDEVGAGDVEALCELVRHTLAIHAMYIEWFEETIDALVGHYTKHLIKPRKRPGFSLKEDTKIIDQ
jgi:hypothetical protein